jgi:hypothetical protein
MIEGKGKAREKRDDDATLPLRAFTMCLNNAMDNRVANLVFDGHVLYRCPISFVRTSSHV